MESEPRPEPAREVAVRKADASWEDIVRKSIRAFCRGFLIAYGVRAGLGIFARILALVRKNPYALFSLKNLFSEKKLVFRVEAAKLGLFFGGFTGVHEFVEKSLTKASGNYEGWHSFVAGSLAGSTVLLQDKDRRRTLALYMCTRLVQCLYNSAKAKGKWHFWGSSWAHGDTLLFALSSAQVMYAYVMRPETLPPEYWSFIVKTGPISKPCLSSIRNRCRGHSIDAAALMNHASRLNPSAVIPTIANDVDIVPCGILHPQSELCFRENALRIWLDAFKRTFPLYASINFVPYIALNFKKFFKQPVKSIVHASIGSVQSTSFLASFVAIYQMVVCLHRAAASRDSRYIYYIAGIFSSLSILIEKKGRRSELALYVLPRAADSLFMIMNDRKWLSSIPNGEVYLFALSMGGLMYFFRQEPDTMAPLIKSIFSKFIGPLKSETKALEPVKPADSSFQVTTEAE